jgi:hypothetical protein
MPPGSNQPGFHKERPVAGLGSRSCTRASGAWADQSCRARSGGSLCHRDPSIELRVVDIILGETPCTASRSVPQGTDRRPSTANGKALCLGPGKVAAAHHHPQPHPHPHPHPPNCPPAPRPQRGKAAARPPGPDANRQIRLHPPHRK